MRDCEGLKDRVLVGEGARAAGSDGGPDLEGSPFVFRCIADCSGHVQAQFDGVLGGGDTRRGPADDGSRVPRHGNAAAVVDAARWCADVGDDDGVRVGVGCVGRGAVVPAPVLSEPRLIEGGALAEIGTADDEAARPVRRHVVRRIFERDDGADCGVRVLGEHSARHNAGGAREGDDDAPGPRGRTELDNVVGARGRASPLGDVAWRTGWAKRPSRAVERDPRPEVRCLDYALGGFALLLVVEVVAGGRAGVVYVGKSELFPPIRPVLG
jgi:hypothetical protein